MLRYIRIAVFCGAAMVFASSSAFAAEKLVTPAEPNAILDVAKGFGRASLSKDKQGDPWIEGKMDGLVYNVFFYGCKNGADCEIIQFETGWGKDARNISLEEINAWNARKLFAHAFLNKDGLVRLRMDVLMQHGVSEQNLDAQFGVWRSLIREFHSTVMAKIK